ncbi:MAG: beta-lactamase class [Acidimicrobiales bacterium]|nr:beta-lactamase class [Acidimicrobiales bacterium]
MAGWPVPHAAAAVVGRNGLLDSTGDLARPFRLASVTKLLTAYATLVAVEEETLDLHEPAGPPGATVEHLLAHASGLGFDTGPLSKPGRRRIYSNTGYEALGHHLAARAGMPFDEYLSAAVLDPLGMAGSDLRERSPAAGAWGTVADLVRFVAEVMDPTLLAPSTVADATRVHFPGLDGVLPELGPQRPNDWGLGFEIRGHKSPHWTGTENSAATFGHFGGAGTFLWVDPELRVACIALTDREFGPWALEAWPPVSDAVVAWVRATVR